MKFFTGVGVSLRSVSICVVDEAGEVRYEAKVAAEVDVIVTALRRFSSDIGQVGFEAGGLRGPRKSTTSSPALDRDARLKKRLFFTSAGRSCDRSARGGVGLSPRKVSVPTPSFSPPSVQTQYE